MNLSRIYWLLFVCILAACQPTTSGEQKSSDATVTHRAKKVKVEKFFIRYLKPEKETSSQVSFLVGDSIENIQSIAMADVKIQDRAMRLQNLGQQGIRYNYRSKLAYSSSYNFQYQYEDGQAANHQVVMTPIDEFLIKEGHIKKSKGFTLVWKGEALQENQQMVLMFTDQNKVAVYATIEGPTDIPEYTLDPDQLPKFTNGSSELYLVKKQFNKKEEGNRIIIDEMEYYTEAIPVNISE